MTYSSSGYQMPTPPASVVDSPLTPRHLMLLNMAVDLMLDAGQARTLTQALSGTDSLDVVRLLAQQWGKGLTTLSGDLNYVHERHIQPALAAQFAAGIKAALLNDAALRDLSGDHKQVYAQMVRYMAQNQPHQAAWCAARLWSLPRLTN